MACRQARRRDGAGRRAVVRHSREHFTHSPFRQLSSEPILRHWVRKISDNLPKIKESRELIEMHCNPSQQTSLTPPRVCLPSAGTTMLHGYTRLSSFFVGVTKGQSRCALMHSQTRKKETFIYSIINYYMKLLGFLDHWCSFKILYLGMQAWGRSDWTDVWQNLYYGVYCQWIFFSLPYNDIILFKPSAPVYDIYMIMQKFNCNTLQFSHASVKEKLQASLAEIVKLPPRSANQFVMHTR